MKTSRSARSGQLSEPQTKRTKSSVHERPAPVAPGTIVTGRLLLKSDKYKLQPGTLLVEFRAGFGSRLGKVDVTQLEDPERWSEKPFDSLKDGQFVRGVVLKRVPNTPSSPFIDLSLRPSLVSKAMEGNGEAAADIDLDDCQSLPKIDTILPGYVVASSAKGCFIRLNRNLTGRVMLKNLSHGFIKDVEAEFPLGKLVAGKVLSVDELGRKVELTLKASAVVGDAERKWAWSHLKSGMMIDGKIHRIIPSGILVDLPSAGHLVGLCHLSEVFDDEILDSLKRRFPMKSEKTSTAYVENLKAMIIKKYKEGASVKCMVLDVSEEEKKVKLSLKSKYFEHALDEGNGNSSSSSAAFADDGIDNADVAAYSDTAENDDPADAPDEYEADDASSDRSSVSNDNDDVGALTLQDALTAADSSGLDTPVAEEPRQVSLSGRKGAEPEATEIQGNDGKSLNNRRKDALRRAKEAKTSELEDRLAKEGDPETVEQFERALISQSHLSLVWIKYISLLVSIGEMDKARQVAERAILAVPAEEEEERKNLWNAYLTLELQFGTIDAAKALFSRMVRMTNEKWAYLALCDAYVSLPETFTDKRKLAEEAIRGAKKASKQKSAKVWIRNFQLKFDFEDTQAGRKLLKEALRVCPDHKHIKLMMAFARLEFSHELGDKERARTIMDGILDSFPKRTDIWNVFTDMEIKYGDSDHVRRLFERALDSKMSSKKVRSLFKKWIQFEASDKGGGESYVEDVKERARQYVAGLLKRDDADESDD